MTRLLFGLAVAAVVLTVYALVDAALFDRSRIRGLPRFAWILAILFVPVIGALLWFVVGRGRRGSSPRGPRTVAPDDDLEFLGQLGRDAQQEQRIRRLEQELSDLDGGTPRPGTPNAGPRPGTTPGTGPGAATPGGNDETGDAPGPSGSRDA
ncbi:PLD nuclease N-terminal domain-containing protein [Microterricola viridarii]|uniref:Phospholipase_D-nuclease N-terminal n=1 Tax=Microterricola viridarii TaxID=412690 RepID=A0A1H1MYL4_9MICO|nr:PLD nuclease N-terminal domain-containing protein [Microterricola viridarii]SDR91698.1 Phospholipase_D-nuclease N-terminal [Microterricola viridarii]